MKFQSLFSFILTLSFQSIIETLIFLFGVFILVIITTSNAIFIYIRRINKETILNFFFIKVRWFSLWNMFIRIFVRIHIMVIFLWYWVFWIFNTFDFLWFWIFRKSLRRFVFLRNTSNIYFLFFFSIFFISKIILMSYLADN